MAGSGIEFNLSGNAKEVVNAIEKYTRAVEGATRKTEQMGRRSKRASEDTSKGFAASAQHAKQMVGALAGAIGVGSALQTAIAAIRGGVPEDDRSG